MKNFKAFLCHPIIEAKARYYANYVFPSPKYLWYIDNDRKKAIDMWWVYKYRKHFPWKNPITLNEKITWLSGMSDTSKWTEYTDKYEVRKYVKKMCGDDILTECYGVWNNVDDIDFNSLPQSFAIKCTHDCGSTIIVKDKSSVDIPQIKKYLNECLSKQFGYKTIEPHYTTIRPRILAEELLPLDDSNLSSSQIDYKIWCINGKACFVMVAYDRHLDSESKDYVGHYAIFDLYDLPSWTPIRENLTPWYRDVNFKDIPRPENLEKMVEYAEKLANGFPHVRIDLYNIDNQIYFGEMTFTPFTGRILLFTDEFQERIGRMIKLPTI